MVSHSITFLPSQELYGDKAFFDKLKGESVKQMKYKGETVDLIDEGLLLLHGRSDFFQQLNPIYARKYEKKMNHRMCCTKVRLRLPHIRRVCCCLATRSVEP